MKKFFILALSLAMFASTCTAFANDAEVTILNDNQKEAITSYVQNQIIDSYSEYYTIPEISVEIESADREKNELVIDVEASFIKVLKAKSAKDLPYVQGMVEELSAMSTQSDIDKANTYIESLVKDLEENYIGVKQEENSCFQVRIPANVKGLEMSDKEYKIIFKGEDNFTATMEDFAPPAAKELKENGKNQIKDVITQENVFRVLSSAQDYDRIDARNYIKKWTDACGGCHCSTCDPSISVYNPAYTSYHMNDCANYVSQAIHAGGISTDSTWAPGTTCWYTTGYNGYGLVDYMVDQGIFFGTSLKSKAFAGSIMYFTGYSHVGMVDQNDTVTMTFCAHTYDRKSCSFKNLSGVVFYVPVWDSYANDWTPQ